MFQNMRALCVAATVVLALILSIAANDKANAQAVILPTGKTCFSANVGVNGMLGALATITAGSGGTTGTYSNVPLTGGLGSGATANITVSGGGVTAVTILNPGLQYVVGDTLSAASANIGNVTGFSVAVNSTAINSSLVGGTVGFYTPGTLTPAQTWQNAAQTIQNTNPVQLDNNGCALIYGIGTYRQIVYDNLGNTIWDAPTQVSPVQPYWSGTAGGTANAITVTDPSFTGTDGQSISFVAAFSNTGATTINPSGYGNISVLANSATGPVALTTNQIIAGNIITATYSTQYSDFIISSGQQSVNTYPVIDVLAYGAVGDGITVNNTAIENALTAATASTSSGAGNVLRFPCGVFKMTARPTATIASGQKLTIQGSGSNCTFLYMSGPVGGFLITYGNQFSSFTLSGMTIETDQQGTQNGVKITLTNGLSNEYAPVNEINDVEFRGYDFTTTNNEYWENGFIDVGVSNINFNGGTCNMMSNVPTVKPVGKCYSISGYGSGTNPYAVVFNFTNVTMNGCDTALTYGEWVQGVTITASNVTGCLNGVFTGFGVSATSDVLDQLTINASQFNTYTCAVCVNDPYFNDLIVYGNLFIVDSSTWTPSQGSTGIYVQGVGWVIANNQMGDANQGVDIAIDIASGFASGGLAEGNFIGGFANMFYITASNAQAHLVNNKFFDYLAKSADYGLLAGAGAVLIEDYTPRNYSNLGGSIGGLPCTYAISNSRMVLSDWSGGSYNGAAAGGGAGLTNIMCQCLGSSCTGSWTNH